VNDAARHAEVILRLLARRREIPRRPISRHIFD
jgi:hypothetical protein